MSKDEKRNGLRWSDLNLHDGIIVVYGKGRKWEEASPFEPGSEPIRRWKQLLYPNSDDCPVLPTIQSIKKCPWVGPPIVPSSSILSKVDQLGFTVRGYTFPFYTILLFCGFVRTSHFVGRAPEYAIKERLGFLKSRTKNAATLPE